MGWQLTIVHWLEQQRTVERLLRACRSGHLEGTPVHTVVRSLWFLFDSLCSNPFHGGAIVPFPPLASSIKSSTTGSLQQHRLLTCSSQIIMAALIIETGVCAYFIDLYASQIPHCLLQTSFRISEAVLLWILRMVCPIVTILGYGYLLSAFPCIRFHD